MNRPVLEVADLVRAAGDAFIERSRRWIRWKHVKVLLAIRRCRTAALGGHFDECTGCGYRTTISYNSCRDRHCPKCQTAARDRWIEARREELLSTRYVHVVFTLPRHLAPLVLQNRKVLYNLLFRSSAETLLEVARNPKRLGAEIGFFSVLHSWSQKLETHPHVHCVVPAGGLSPDHTHWVAAPERFFLPREVLAKVFRGKFVHALRQAFRDGQLHFEGDLTLLAQPKIFAAWLRPLYRQDWIVYLKPPFGGPQFVLQYLGRYTHRVAISNHRLVSFADGQVTFRWRDSAHNNEQKLLTLSLDEFLRRFLLHVLPKGSCASVTLAFWPPANVPPPCHSASSYSARNRPPSNRPPPRMTQVLSGCAPNVVRP
jgi:Putative transposase/Transposase zinc-binding domain